ncbi:MAG: EamA family transporter, partial [Reichenbachiella sp.]
ILVSIIAMLMTFYAMKHIGAMNLSIYFSFVPFVTAILAWNILGESLAIYEIAAIVLCSIGLLIYARK